MEIDEDDVSSVDLFREPDDFYKPDKPATSAAYVLRDRKTVKLQLVGYNPLWGHLLWNAGQVIADYLEENVQRLVVGKTVLELGAGAGLPSLVCAIRGARQVVVTDYPDPDLIENLRHNIALCDSEHSHTSIVAEGYLWGNPVDALKSHLELPAFGFDILILADILFNHSEHAKLVTTLQSTLKKDVSARALVFFTPYRPWLLERDLRFFDLARAGGFSVEKVLEKTMEKVMFDEDPGDELLRRTVFGYEVQWQK